MKRHEEVLEIGMRLLAKLEDLLSRDRGRR
jgi:hypothetical protein